MCDTVWLSDVHHLFQCLNTVRGRAFGCGVRRGRAHAHTATHTHTHTHTHLALCLVAAHDGAFGHDVARGLALEPCAARSALRAGRDRRSASLDLGHDAGQAAQAGAGAEEHGLGCMQECISQSLSEHPAASQRQKQGPAGLSWACERGRGYRGVRRR